MVLIVAGFFLGALQGDELLQVFEAALMLPIYREEQMWREGLHPSQLKQQQQQRRQQQQPQQLPQQQQQDMAEPMPLDATDGGLCCSLNRCSWVCVPLHVHLQVYGISLSCCGRQVAWMVCMPSAVQVHARTTWAGTLHAAYFISSFSFVACAKDFIQVAAVNDRMSMQIAIAIAAVPS